MHEVLKFEDVNQCMDVAAKFICKHAVASIEKHGVFTFALAGGNTPRSLYRALAKLPYRNDMPWQKTQVFWGDERYVPNDHPDNNFKMAYEEMLSGLSLDEHQIHRVPVEEPTVEKAADAYEKDLRQFFDRMAGEDEERRNDPFPRFDLILLGMGADGHIASLFPESPALKEKKKWVAVEKKPGAPPHVPRITLTVPVINNAACVTFLVTGKEKHELVSRIADGIEGAPPAAQISPVGSLVWFISS
ncbi:MAG: 6-phosphogluconolactonase [Pseudomonadota bacterium]